MALQYSAAQAAADANLTQDQLAARSQAATLPGAGTGTQAQVPTTQVVVNPLPQTAAPAQTTQPGQQTPDPAGQMNPILSPPTDQNLAPGQIPTPITQLQPNATALLGGIIGTRPSPSNPQTTEYYNTQTGQGFANPQALSTFVNSQTPQAGTTADNVFSYLGSQAGQASASAAAGPDFSGLQNTVDSILSKYGITPPVAGTDPFSSIMDAYTKVFTQLGLPDLKTNIDTVTSQYNDLNTELASKTADINENPWLDEGTRERQITALQQRYDLKLSPLNSQIQLYQGMYTQGVNQAQFVAGSVYDTYHANQTSNQSIVAQAIQTAESQAIAAFQMKGTPVNLGTDPNTGLPVQGVYNPQTGTFQPINPTTGVSGSGGNPATTGNIPNDQNNPMSITLGPATQQYVDSGQASVYTTADGRKFLSFKDPAVGMQAGENLLFNSGIYSNMTVNDALKKWSRGAYGAEIAPFIQGNSLTIGDIGSIPQLKDQLAQAIAKREGFSGGSNQTQSGTTGNTNYAQYGLLSKTNFNPTTHIDALANSYLSYYLKNAAIPTARALGLSTTQGTVFTAATQRAQDLYFQATGSSLPNVNILKSNTSLVSTNNQLLNTLNVQEGTIGKNFQLAISNLDKSGINQNSQPINDFLNSIHNLMGDPATAQYLAQNSTLQNELGNLISLKNASGTTVADKLTSSGLLPKGASEDQQKSILKILLQEANNGVSTLNSVNADIYKQIDPLEQDPNNPNRQATINGGQTDGTTYKSTSGQTYNLPY